MKKSNRSIIQLVGTVTVLYFTYLFLNFLEFASRRRPGTVTTDDAHTALVYYASERLRIANITSVIS